MTIKVPIAVNMLEYTAPVKIAALQLTMNILHRHDFLLSWGRKSFQSTSHEVQGRIRGDHEEPQASVPKANRQSCASESCLRMSRLANNKKKWTTVLKHRQSQLEGVHVL